MLLNNVHILTLQQLNATTSTFGVLLRLCLTDGDNQSAWLPTITKRVKGYSKSDTRSSQTCVIPSSRPLWVRRRAAPAGMSPHVAYLTQSAQFHSPVWRGVDPAFLFSLNCAIAFSSFGKETRRKRVWRRRKMLCLCALFQMSLIRPGEGTLRELSPHCWRSLVFA